MAACGGVLATQQSVGPWGIFTVIGIIAAAAYLLGGIAYQRTVMHQRGWRQLPNYALWAGIWGFVMVRLAHDILEEVLIRVIIGYRCHHDKLLCEILAKEERV